MNEAQNMQFEKDYDDFVSQLDAPILLPDDGSGVGKTGLPLLFEYVKHTVEANGGYSSVSVFQISLAELVKAGELKKLSVQEEPTIPEDVLALIKDAESGKISTYELRRKYTSDRRFRDFYDAYVGIAQSAAPQPITLSAQDYRSMPTAVIQKRCQQEPAFKAAVDKLFAEGRV
jgi:hypothetical protein